MMGPQMITNKLFTSFDFLSFFFSFHFAIISTYITQLFSYVIKNKQLELPLRMGGMGRVMRMEEEEEETEVILILSNLIWEIQPQDQM